MNSCDSQLSQRPRIAAIVVTHNRRADLAACLCAIRQQSYPVETIVVVDNASNDGTDMDVAMLDGITYIRLSQNLGGAGGFAAGTRVGADSGADWLWLLDDDCIPSHSCLHQLVQAAEDSADSRLGALSPAVGADPLCATFGFLRNPSRALRTCANASASAPCYDTPIDWSAFAGLLLRASAYTSTGAIRDDFFIWNDDTEYCLRMRLGGWHILGVPGAFVEHPLRPRITRRLFAREWSVSQADAWLEYFGVRNLIYVDWLYANTPFRDGRSLAWRVLHELSSAAKVLVLDRSCGAARAGSRFRGVLAALCAIATRQVRFTDTSASEGSDLLTD